MIKTLWSYKWAICISLVAYFLYPIFKHDSVLGDQTEFTGCKILQIDLKSGQTYESEETIHVHTVDHGMRLVEAETADGAAYGLGFTHATDRLWQLKFTRLLAQGRMSELLGPEGFEIDRLMRSVGTQRTTQVMLEHLPEEELVFLENYSAGINKVVNNVVVYPPEFQLFATDFEEWTPFDSCSIGVLISFLLAQDPFVEILRQRLLEVYDRELVEKLVPFKKENYVQYEKMEVISDEELAKIGLLEDISYPKTLYQMTDAEIYHSPNM